MPKNKEEQIKQRAYEIWEEEGRPHGEDLRHWVKALEEIARTEESAGAKKSRRRKDQAGKVTKNLVDNSEHTGKPTAQATVSTSKRKISAAKSKPH